MVVVIYQWSAISLKFFVKSTNGLFYLEIIATINSFDLKKVFNGYKCGGKLLIARGSEQKSAGKLMMAGDSEQKFATSEQKSAGKLMMAGGGEQKFAPSEQKFTGKLLMAGGGEQKFAPSEQKSAANY